MTEAYVVIYICYTQYVKHALVSGATEVPDK